MEQKDIKRLVKALMGAGALLLLILIIKPQNYIRITDNSSTEKKPLANNECPIFLTTSQHGDINLPVGTIFGYPSKSDGKIYDIIRDDTFIMSAYFVKDFERDFKCFKTEDEAMAMGYKKFLSDQAASKKARDEAKKFLDEQREGGHATDTARTLQSIDAVLGL